MAIHAEPGAIWGSRMISEILTRLPDLPGLVHFTFPDYYTTPLDRVLPGKAGNSVRKVDKRALFFNAGKGAELSNARN